jgi:hypothetical protein
MIRQLLNDEAGFVVSAELVLIGTLLVVGLVVGLAEVQHSVVSELNDIADAVGSLNQSYAFTGFTSRKEDGSVKAFSNGSFFIDLTDACDNNQCTLDCDRPQPEAPKGR